ncbi:MAG: hypothetical protein JXB38_09810 [Anaerolineales bacterium]|nr:hypothetical protein [Anaerolineales bacterium]
METEHSSFKVWLRKFLIELVLYGLLVVGYFFLALRYLGDPLARLFQDNLRYYAIASLLLIVAQGVLLDFVVTFLLDFFGLDRLE